MRDDEPDGDVARRRAQTVAGLAFGAGISGAAWSWRASSYGFFGGLALVVALALGVGLVFQARAAMAVMAGIARFLQAWSKVVARWSPWFRVVVAVGAFVGFAVLFSALRSSG